MNQHTLASPIEFSGVGIHSGKPSTMKILPAPAGHGIVFSRGGRLIAASYANVARSRRSTSLSLGGVRVRTPEHILSALCGLGIDNALIELDREEVPIMDGSALPFAEALLKGGLKELPAERRYIKVPERFEFSSGGSRLVIEPAAEPSFEVEIDFNSKVIGLQKAVFDFSMDYVREIAPCRTFCFLGEVRRLRLLGLIRGGTLDNALVVDEPRGYYGGAVPRFSNECARHKLLDLVGDFSLAGAPVLGKIYAYKPGHRFNTSTLAALMKIL